MDRERKREREREREREKGEKRRFYIFATLRILSLSLSLSLSVFLLTYVDALKSCLCLLILEAHLFRKKYYINCLINFSAKDLA